MKRFRLPVLVFGLALCAMAATMHVAAGWQQDAATRAARDTSIAVQSLTAMLDQETGLRGFQLTASPDYLEPYDAGRRAFDRAVGRARAAYAPGTSERRYVEEQVMAARRWQRSADARIAEIRRSGKGPLDRLGIDRRRAAFDSFRAVNRQLQDELTEHGEERVRRAGLHSTLAVIGLTLLLVAGAWLGFRRFESARRQREAAEAAYRESQREFTDVVQVVRGENDAHGLLKRHLERSIPGARATVLSRDNSGDRLIATTPLPDDEPLGRGLTNAEPASCVALRLSRRHSEVRGEEPLVSCELCSTSQACRRACQPLVIGGQHIGAVLVEHDEPLDEQASRRLMESVTQAAPALANLRTIAMAERRAATDALTGLPNRRAVQDAIARMVAQATRTGSPLSALAIDLDQFKLINDRHGHDVGDTVLAHVATLLCTLVRSSDFVGRMGGEEFLVLAPDTDPVGAATLAENVRAAIAHEQIAGLDECVTASFGVATIPDHATTAPSLLRIADRAMYEAKDAGRNRVVTARGATEPAG